MLLSCGIGRSLDDLKYNYTIDQIYHFYMECKKVQFTNWKMDAMIKAQANIYTSPSSDKGHANSKQRSWEKFMDSLTWDKLEKKKQKKSATGFLNMFQKTGLIPIQKK